MNEKELIELHDNTFKMFDNMVNTLKTEIKNAEELLEQKRIILMQTMTIKIIAEALLKDNIKKAGK